MSPSFAKTLQEVSTDYGYNMRRYKGALDTCTVPHPRVDLPPIPTDATRKTLGSSVSQPKLQIPTLHSSSDSISQPVVLPEITSGATIFPSSEKEHNETHENSTTASNSVVAKAKERMTAVLTEFDAAFVGKS